MEFLLFIMATIVISQFIVDSPYLKWFRERISFLRCSQCVGIISGIICGFILTDVVYLLIVCGFAGGFLSDLSERVFNYIEAKSIYEK